MNVKRNFIYATALFLSSEYALSAQDPSRELISKAPVTTEKNNDDLRMNKTKLPKADPSGRFIPTLNKMGYMTTHLDPYSQAFVEYAAKTREPVLEIGAAYGVATLAALSAGATVFCNDIDLRHLKIVEQNTAKKDLHRLKLVPGAFPRELNFPNETFRAILIARVLHFFDPETLELSLKKSYEWLKPGGKLVIVADTPYLKNMASFIPEYERRVKNGDKWPGIMGDPKKYVNNPNFHHFIHVLDVNVLTRILLEQGFEIEKIETLNRTDYPPDRQLDGRESVAAIARKPVRISSE